MKMKLRLILAATLLTGLVAPHLLAQEQPGAGADTHAPPALKPEAPPAKPEARKKQAPKKKPAAEKKAAQTKSPAPAETEKSAPLIHPGPAIVKEKNVNVRGQAAINSEVVTRLKKGDLVTVLEEITTPKPHDAEITQWARIALPSSVQVWVSSLHVDPDNKTVKATQLRLRAGPGENYSTLGMIKKGTAIKEVETKGDWIKIDAPAEAFGFVAAHLLTNAPAAEIAAAKPPAVTAPPTAPPPAAPPPTPTTVGPPETVAPAQPITPAEVKPPETNPPAATPPPAETTPGAKVADAAPPSPPPAAPAPPPAPQEETLVKRIVSREGYVRNTVSIQAPSYYKLESLDTKRTINYICSPTTNVLLRDFFGKRIIITGEEVLDERWPNTPVINVESITTVP
jgi:uncharacterized protein YgiM (DUF1202 family)